MAGKRTSSFSHALVTNLVYRAFTRIDAGDVPDAKTILKIARVLGAAVIEPLDRVCSTTWPERVNAAHRAPASISA